MLKCVKQNIYSIKSFIVKGKQFKFDAIECMLNDLSDKTELELAYLLVSDYGNPGQMVDAKTAIFKQRRVFI